MFKVHVDNQGFVEKPETDDIKQISKRIVRNLKVLSVQELAEDIAEGKSVVLGVMQNSRNKNNLVSQQVIMLDFDNKDKNNGKEYITMAGLMNNEFILNNACFMYKTFNYEFKWEKFRVVFVLDEPVTNNEDVDKIYNFLFDMFPSADFSCRDSSRIFFGSKEPVIEVDFNNVLNASEIINAVTQTLPSVTRNVSNNEIVEWFKAKDREQLKLYYGDSYSITLHSFSQVVNYLKHINMQEFFNVEVMPFNDFFSDDVRPSSSIFKLDNSSVYLYKCFSEENYFIGDLIYVVRKLLDVDYMEAKDFLMDILNIKISVTENIQNIRDQFDYILETLLSDELKHIFPSINTILWRYKTDIHAIISIFKENIYEDSEGNIRSLSWLSTRNLSLKLYGKETKYDHVAKLLNLMTYTEFVAKLEESDIPKELLEQLIKHQKQNKHLKRSNVFELLPLSSDFFVELNRTCEFLKEVNFSLKSFTKTFMEQNKGKDTADKVFLQDKEVTNPKHLASMARKEQVGELITRIILEEISTKGYMIEKDLFTHMQNEHGINVNSARRLYKEFYGNIMASYDLKRVCLSNELREQFNIKLPKNNRPYLLIK